MTLLKTLEKLINMFDLSQWAEATYQNCIDPTIGRDAEETPEVHECIICEQDFFHKEGKLIDHEDKWCNKCASEENIRTHYKKVADLTEGQIKNLKSEPL